MTDPVKQRQITTILTLIIVVFWIITAVVRIWVPWDVASVLDSAMPLVIGYWFVSNSTAKKNGNGNGKEPVAA